MIQKYPKQISVSKMDKILIWITKLHDTKVSSESQIWKKNYLLIKKKSNVSLSRWWYKSIPKKSVYQEINNISIWITKLHDTKVSAESQIWKKKLSVD